jgi:hypothetical protein
MSVKLPKCPNGTRRNKRTKLCEPTQLTRVQAMAPPSPPPPPIKPKRCPKGTRKNKKTGLCEPNNNNALIPQRETHNVAPPNEEKAKLILQNFWKRTKHARKALFLKNICADSGVCIAFGKETDKIKHFFNNFTQFDYAVSLKRIGAVSANGFINEITYKHRDYLAHAILKSSSKPSADNLMYEYVVGMIINTNFCKYFPSFVETYGCYLYKDTPSWNKMKNGTSTISDLKSDLLLQPNINYKQSCVEPVLTSVLIQHIKDAVTLKSMLGSSRFISFELINCLYQIYYTLSECKNRFTHYDLHIENVLLYEPVKNKYIHYHYHMKDGSVLSFKSKYIAKIIDYGRSYVKISPTIYKTICGIPDCNVGTTCGRTLGYRWLDPTPNAHHISSVHRNMSHDLRLLSILKIYNIGNPELAALISKTKYGGIYGTVQNAIQGFPNSINNVADARLCLEEEINTSFQKTKNNAIHKLLTNKIGDLHIYGEGREMNFVSHA